MNNKKFNWIFLLFCGITASCFSLYGQQYMTAPLPEHNDSLFTKYLSDTLHATEKIQALVNNAKSLGNSPQARATALQYYQVAMALEPYSRNSPQTLFRLHADFAGLLHNLGSNEFAMENWKRALSLYRTYQPHATSESCNIMGSMVGYYIYSGQYDSAFYYYDLALDEAIKTKNELLVASAYNNIGMLKVKTRDYAGAHTFYEKSLGTLHLISRGDSSLWGSIIDNMAELAVIEKKWAEAATYYEENISFFTQFGFDQQRLFKSWCGAINVMLKTGNISGAAKQFTVLDTLYNQYSSLLKDEHRLAYYNLKLDYALATNNRPAIAGYHDRISSLKDSINAASQKVTDPLAKAIINITMNKFDKDLQLYQLQLTQKERDLEEARKKQMGILIITVITILCSVLLYLYFRNRSRLQKNEIRLQQYKHQLAEKELENKKLEQQRTEQELQYKKSDLHNLGVYLNHLKQLHHSMSDKLDTLKNQKSDQIKNSISTLVHEWDTEIYSQKQLQLIQENIDLINSEFYANLHKAYPGLTKSEVELCGLFKLNLSSKEIGIVKGISQESVKMARYRLRKKLNLKPEDDIYKSLSVI